MAEPLSWLFSLFDKVSAPADTMSKALTKLDDNFDKTGKAAQALANFFSGGAVTAFDKFAKATEDAAKKAEAVKNQTKSFGVEFGKVNKLGSSFDLDKLMSGGFAGAFTLGIGEGISLLVDGIKAAIGLLIDAGKKAFEIGAEFVKASAGAQKVSFQFSRLPGGAEAENLFNDIAKHTEFDDDALKKMFRPLVAAGFKGEGLKNAVAAALDVAGTGGDAGEVVNALKKIHTTGRIDAKGLAGAFEGLFSEQEFLEQLSKKLGTTKEDAKKRMEADTIATDDLLNVLYSKIAERNDGVLGKTGVDASTLMDTRLRKLSELPSQFMKVLSNTSGFGSLSDFLGRLLEAFDPDGPRGKLIIAGIQRMFNKVLGFVDGLGDEALFDKIMEGILTVIGAIEVFATGIITVVRAIGLMIEWGEKLVGWFHSLDDVIGFGLIDTMNDLGNSVVDGFVEGIKGGYDKVVESVEGLGAKARDSLKEFLGIASPSKVFEDFGEMSAEGFNRGLTGGADPDLTDFAPTSRGGGGGSTIQINEGAVQINLQSSGNPAHDEAMAQLARRHMLEALEEFTDQQGG